MNALEAYKFPVTGNNIRMANYNGVPVAMAADVCRELGYDTSVVTNALKDHCHEGQYVFIPRSNLSPGQISFPNRGANFVTEGGLYALIMGSRKPEALAFKAWVTDVVLPSIRKTGSYQLPTAKLPTGERVVIHQNLGNTKREQGERLITQGKLLIEIAEAEEHLKALNAQLDLL